MVNKVQFRSGEAFGIVAQWFAAVVDIGDDRRLCDALADLADRAFGGSDDVIDAIAELPPRFLPSFIVCVAEGSSVRIIVRGGMGALVAHGGTSEVIDSGDVRTWRETSIENPAELRLGLHTSIELPPTHWVTSGVVPASMIMMSLGEDSEPEQDVLRNEVGEVAISVPQFNDEPLESGASDVDPAEEESNFGSADTFASADVPSADTSSDLEVLIQDDDGDALSEVPEPESVDGPPPAVLLDDDLNQREPEASEDGSDDDANGSPEEFQLEDDGFLEVAADVVDQECDVADEPVPLTFDADEAPESAPLVIEIDGADADEGADVLVEEEGRSDLLDEDFEHSNKTLIPGDDWGEGASNAPLEEEPEDPYESLWKTKIGSASELSLGVHPTLGQAPPPLPDVEMSQPGGVKVDQAYENDLIDGDHDGYTMTIDALRSSLSSPPSPPSSDPVEADSSGVPMSPCVNGHPNPPFAATCRRCLAPVRDVIERVQRADAGVLILPNGDRIDVDRTIVIGRNPKAPGIFSGEPPRLVTLSDYKDISRTHALVELSGWTATVTDQGSMNGTEVQLPGKLPEQLRPNTPMALVIGAKIILAGDVVIKLDGG